MKIINLLSGPRNISTALMCSFSQRNDTVVMDEPFYGYYLSIRPEVEHPGRQETVAALSIDKDEVISDILSCEYERPNVFIKNMAHHLIDMDLSFLRKLDNVFLIRDPKQIIASFAQVIPNPTIEDIGLKRQVELFHFLGENHRIKPLVVDSGQILKDPKKVLNLLCIRLGIEFDSRMLHWKGDELKLEAPWAKYWYSNVRKSNGFAPQKTSERPLPAQCEALYKESLPYYEELFQYSIKA